MLLTSLKIILISLFLALFVMQIPQFITIKNSYDKNTKQYEICSISNRQLQDELNNKNIGTIGIHIKEQNEEHLLLVDKQGNLYDNSFYLTGKINLNENGYQKVKNEIGNEYTIKIYYTDFGNFKVKYYGKNIIEKLENIYFKYLFSEPFVDLYYKYYFKNN